MTSFVSRAGSRLLSGFTLRESLVVGLCAVFIVLAALLLHIPGLLPGHKLLGVAFFLLLGRGCLRHPLGATAIGLLAGLIALLSGTGAWQPPACAPIRQCRGRGRSAVLVRAGHARLASAWRPGRRADGRDLASPGLSLRPPGRHGFRHCRPACRASGIERDLLGRACRLACADSGATSAGQRPLADGTVWPGAGEPVMAQPVLAVRHLHYRHGDGLPLDLVVPLTVFPGQAVAITGPSGSGKTTLLRALAGHPPEGATVEWDADALPARPALFLQDPEAQLLCSSVEEEVELGPRNQGLTGEALERRVAEALGALDIAALAGRDIQALSMGQKHRVVLAALLAMRPDVLLLDEPFSQLDAAGEARLRELIAALTAQGRTVVITTHAVDPADPLWNVRLELPASACGNLRPWPPQAVSGAPRRPGGGRPVLVAQGLGFVLQSGTRVFEAVDFTLERGTTSEICGGNATGKSTLLRCLAGILSPSAGRISIDGKPAPKPGRLAGRLGYLPQNADMLLFEESVRREVGFTLRRLMASGTAREARLQDTLQACGLEDLASRPPLSLSHGERHMLAVASVLAARPAVLLLDEPLTGLDAPVGASLLALLTHFAREYGTAVLLATHGKLPTTWGDHRYLLGGGRLHGTA